MESSHVQSQQTEEDGGAQTELQALREQSEFRQSDEKHHAERLAARLAEVTRERDDLELGCRVLRDKLTRRSIDPAPNEHAGSFSAPQWRSPSVLEFQNLRVAGIVDEFTHSALAPTCTLEQIDFVEWRDQLERFEPQLVFIESAWQGNGGQWANKVHHPSKDFLDLIAWCKSRSVPAVFWNKEDPVHFETFINTAKHFDYVFTTDLDCIGRYKTLLGHERVYLMPFFCQPRLHGPQQIYDRQLGFCFAGAYYVRYPERQKDFDIIIDVARKLAPVDIFDRNYAKRDPNYMFPDRYEDLIKGSLSYADIDRAYKGYEFGINLNSVKQSQTMFARRVFDLMLSNTQVVSNYSRGLRLMFGDLVISTDSADELQSQLKPIVGSSSEASTLRRYRNLLALRKVMLEHTADSRMAYVLSKVSGRPVSTFQQEIVVLATVRSDSDVCWVLSCYKSQHWVHKRLVLVLEDEYVPAGPLPQGSDVEIYTRKDAEGIEPDERWQDCAVAFFCVGDAYGKYYLTDAALALSYTDAEVVGKTAYYQTAADGSHVLRGNGSQYRTVGSLPLRRALMRVSAMQGTVLWDWACAVPSRSIFGQSSFAIDEFNYVADAATPTITLAVENTPIREGLSMGHLYRIAESVPGASSPVSIEKGFGSREIFELFEKAGATGAVRIKKSGHALRIESTLGDSEHKYLYANRQLRISELSPAEGVISYHLVAMPGIRLDVVLIFFARSGERLGQVISTFGKNHEYSVPDETEYVRLGLRVLGPGIASVYGLSTESVPPIGPVPPQLGRARSLLLTNIYPSSDSLYRNAFVHRRVLNYRAVGTHMDVFVHKPRPPYRTYEYEGVDVLEGDSERLTAKLSSNEYGAFCIHFLSPEMWGVVKDWLPKKRVIVWIHGSDVQSWHRRAFNYVTEEQVKVAKEQSAKRIKFWREVLGCRHPNLSFVFVSNYLANSVMEDTGLALPKHRYQVIHNVIDSDLFRYIEKGPEQRFRVLSIRPFASATYANDLSVAAILALRDRPFFKKMEFRIIGEGPLFWETVAPLADMPNVVLEKRFLSQAEISTLHQEYGVFLCPSRMDSQGVSRDEAMSSGLVPVTSAVAAIPEFVDHSCGVLAPEECSEGLAEGMSRLVSDPSLFVRLSRAAAKRVRSQSGFKKTIAAELKLISPSPSRSPSLESA